LIPAIPWFSRGKTRAADTLTASKDHRLARVDS
jgi:hypothetical protein